MQKSDPPQPAALTMRPLTWALLVLLSLCWGASFFFVGVAVSELPTFTIVVSRVILGAVCLWAVVVANADPVPKTASFWRAITVMAMINCILPFLLIVWGQSQVPSSLAAILIASAPLFGIVLAHFMTADERMNLPQVASVVCGFAGVAILIGPGPLLGLGTDVLAELAILAGAICYALATIYGRRFTRDGMSPAVIASTQLTIAAALLLPLELVIDRPWTLAMPSTAAIGAVLGLGFVSTAFGFILYFKILAAAGATNLMLVNFLVPVSAIVLGVAILGDTLTASHFAGMALIFAGLSLRDGKMLSLIGRPRRLSVSADDTPRSR